MGVVLGIVVGVVVGAMVFDERGLILGAVLGWVVAKLLDISSRLKRLEAGAGQRPAPLADFGSEPPVTPAPKPDRVAAPQPAPDPMPASAPTPSVSAPPPAAETATTRDSWTIPESAPATFDEPLIFKRVREWLLGGNTAVRVGVVVLFFGVAFLLKYAIDHAVLPIELRLAGAAVGGIAMLVVGWRLRGRRAGYALTLQGGGIGLLYLTVFATFRIYQLIPAGAAFALLVGIVVFSALLALRQSSLALAVFGMVGGFLAPILTSTGKGSHVMLFSYYALLNAGILFMSWYRAWRVLNLVGFAFTFVIGALWGYRFYRPDFFATTEPFLILFFLMYVTIAILFAWRQPEGARGYVDGTLVFGVPLVGALLQAGLVRNIEYGLAWSSFALGFFYIGLASALWKRAPQTMRLMVEVFLALGVIFATLTIPLALDGRWTVAAWAVEGAGILWVGVRQDRTAPLVFGLLLIFGCGAFFLGDHAPRGEVPVLNAHFVGTLMVALSSLFAGYHLHRAREALHDFVRPAATIVMVWGLVWWYLGGAREIELRVKEFSVATATMLFVAISAALIEIAGRRLTWAALRSSAVVLLPAMALFLVYKMVDGAHPFARSGYAAWLLGFGVFYWIARRQEPDQVVVGPAVQHTIAFLLASAVAVLEVEWSLRKLVPEGRDWLRAAWLLTPAVLLMLVSRPATFWPLVDWRKSYALYGAVPIGVGAVIAVLVTCIASAGDPRPLPYIPLINPLELSSVFLAFALARWWSVAESLDVPDVRDARRIVATGGAVVVFVWLNTILFRSVHHFGGVAYHLEAMMRSVLAQASLSLFWSALALVLVTLATRLARRALWMVGAVLLGVVVLKLFLVDLAGTGTVARIVSFIGVGVLLLVIGYLAPVPPRAATEEEKQ